VSPGPVLAEAFDLDATTARRIRSEWTRTFSRELTVEARAELSELP